MESGRGALAHNNMGWLQLQDADLDAGVEEGKGREDRKKGTLCRRM